MKAYKIIFLVLILASCINEPESKREIVKIDLSSAKTIQLSDIVEKVDYIKLRKPNIPLGRGIVKIEENIIYYWDIEQQVICVFNFDGKMIAKLDRQGRGPGEYYSLGNFVVDKENQVVEVWDRAKAKLIKYRDISFEFISEVKLDQNIIFDNVLKLKNGDYLLSTNEATNSIKDKRTNASFFLVDSLGKVKKVLFDRYYKVEDESNRIFYSLFLSKLIRNDLGEIYGSIDFDNTIYRFKDENFLPAFDVKFINGISINNELLIEMSKKEHLSYFIESNNFVKKASYPNLEINNSKLIVINYLFRENIGKPMNERSYFIRKDIRKTLHIKEIINDLTEFPNRITINHLNQSDVMYKPWYKNSLIQVISPESEIEMGKSIDIDSIGKVNYDDNPIIMLMSLK